MATKVLTCSLFTPSPVQMHCGGRRGRRECLTADSADDLGCENQAIRPQRQGSGPRLSAPLFANRGSPSKIIGGCELWTISNRFSASSGPSAVEKTVIQ